MSKIIGDYEVCVECADSFGRTARLVSLDNGIPEFLSGMMYPFTVNCAFACELYLKAIMIHNSYSNEFDAGHKLDALFDALPERDKNAIEAEFETKSKSDLRKFLRENGNAFVEWRYPLENSVETCVSDFAAFMDSLEKHIASL